MYLSGGPSGKELRDLAIDLNFLMDPPLPGFCPDNGARAMLYSATDYFFFIGGAKKEKSS